MSGSEIHELPAPAAGPDIMLPEQFDDLFRSTERTPEQRLMLAVLEDAIRCWLGAPPALLGGVYTGSKRMRLAREAEHWLFDGEDWAPISFHTCCGALGIDGEWLREKLRRIADPGPRRLRRIRPAGRINRALDMRQMRGNLAHDHGLGRFAVPPSRLPYSKRSKRIDRC